MASTSDVCRLQRARVALKAKGVKFDVINCNLKNKPKFLTDAHPNGQVPVLLHKGNVIVESEIIVGEASHRIESCTLTMVHSSFHFSVSLCPFCDLASNLWFRGGAC